MELDTVDLSMPAYVNTNFYRLSFPASSQNNHLKYNLNKKAGLCPAFFDEHLLHTHGAETVSVTAPV